MIIDGMFDKSIRRLDKCEARALSRIMGFEQFALDDYIDRWVVIKIESPKKIKGSSGKYYKNG